MLITELCCRPKLFEGTWTAKKDLKKPMDQPTWVANHSKFWKCGRVKVKNAFETNEVEDYIIIIE